MAVASACDCVVACCPTAAAVDAFASIAWRTAAYLCVIERKVAQCCSIRQATKCASILSFIASSCFHIRLAGCGVMCSGRRTMLLGSHGTPLGTARFVCLWWLRSPHHTWKAFRQCHSAFMPAAPEALWSLLLTACVGEAHAFCLAAAAAATVAPANAALISLADSAFRQSQLNYKFPYDAGSQQCACGERCVTNVGAARATAAAAAAAVAVLRCLSRHAAGA
ncbi:hypothetical protein COO60DRAFT_682080 [Scenedesmus sp. NREL 46B-D3]|nr:hypothetical protein COO60DRAFT_682080 [Scenedesmus sp. NREL 46B-D3]